MSRAASLLLGIASVLALAASARGVTIVDTLPGNASGSGSGFGSGQEGAEAFTPAATTTLGHIDVDVRLSSGASTNRIELDVWDSNGTLPGSTLIASASLDGLASPAGGVIGADFATLPSLLGGQTYWIALRIGAGTGLVTWVASQAGGSADEPYRESATGPWQHNPSGVAAFRVLDSTLDGGAQGPAPVPEPTGWALATLAGGLAAAVRRRRPPR